MIDALNVGPYAGRLKVPVLLTKTNEIDTKILDEIKRLKAKEVIIIGGVNAVSENVANQLKAKGLTVNRIFGENRYETALKVAEEAIDNGVLKSNKIFHNPDIKSFPNWLLKKHCRKCQHSQELTNSPCSSIVRIQRSLPDRIYLHRLNPIPGDIYAMPFPANRYEL